MTEREYNSFLDLNCEGREINVSLNRKLCAGNYIFSLDLALKERLNRWVNNLCYFFQVGDMTDEEREYLSTISKLKLENNVKDVLWLLKYAITSMEPLVLKLIEREHLLLNQQD